MCWKEIGIELKNNEVVRNPFTVSPNAAPPWLSDASLIKLACIDRLHPPAKGQDLILRVLARPHWRSRPITVSFFGTGPMSKDLDA